MSDRLPRRLGKYEIRESLGQGGMAEVWRAFDPLLRRDVAIKVMHPNLSTDPEFMTRFTREAQVIAALRHPNIVRIYDFHAGDQSADSDENADAIAYMVMEYIQGQTLAQYLRGDTRADDLSAPAAIIRLFTPICLALDYAHQQGVIHRDIKPSNILLDQRNTTRTPMGEPVLSDFGLAKLLEGGAATITGAVIGTPLYMSPEQIQDKPLSDRADLYSLGAVLYEVCAGAPPFEGDSAAGILVRHITEPVAPPSQRNPQLPAPVSDVLVKSLAKDPQERYPSASALLAALAEAFGISAPEEITAMAALRERAPQAAEDVEATILPPKGLDRGPDKSPAISATVPASAQAATERAVAPSKAKDSPQAVKAAPSETTPASLSMRIAAAPLAVRRLRGPRLVIAIALVCALLASGLGALIYRSRQGAAAAPVSASVGQVYFLNSGQANAWASVGINDELQINLQGIPAPHSGKSYYAWLLSDLRQSEAPDILLGKLTVQQGAIHFLYTGDSHHTDLLAITSRFLITEEAANVTPDIPSPDLSAWRYYAQLPQTPASGQKYSLLDHLRHLLAKDPDLEPLHLHGGLVIWAFRDTRQVYQWALSARDDWNAHNYYGVRERAIAILDYLDGSANVSRDVPAGTPIVADSRIAQVGLLDFDPARQDPPGYLYHIALHLNGVLQAPGATQNQRAEATKITGTLNAVKTALTHARQEAATLARMTDSQLAQPATLGLLNDLVNATTTAYQGQPSTGGGQSQGGMSQLYPEVQRLSTFTVTTYRQTK
jgi:serine/threonine protein kinase